MNLALTGLFRAKWTDEINAEWGRSLIKNRPDLSQADVDRVIQKMNEHIGDALVKGYEVLIPSMTGLPDPDDRHVLAAAIVGRANVIVTYNLKDFPNAALDPYS